MVRQSTTIQAGTGVMVKKAKNLKYVYVEEGKKEKMDNFFFPCKDIIGKEYGTAFKVGGRDLEIIDPVQVEEHRAEYEKLDAGETNEVTQDNRDIVDCSATQKLDKDTIMGFRDDGMEGDKIVEKLVENSATFKERTEFSQAKYLKKKEKKYLKHFVALRPTARLLCEMYFTRAPDKILEIRPDTLAQILTWSNVQYGSRMLCVDSCKGLIVGSLLERMGIDTEEESSSVLLQVHQGNEPVRTVVEQMNFTADQVARVTCSFSLNKLELLKQLLDQQREIKKKLATTTIPISLTSMQESPCVPEIGTVKTGTEGSVGVVADSTENIGNINDITSQNKNVPLASSPGLLSREDLLEQILGKNFRNDAPPTITITKADGDTETVTQEDSTMEVESNTKDAPSTEDAVKQEDEGKPHKGGNRKRKFPDPVKGGYSARDPSAQPSLPRVSFLSRERRREECGRAIELMGEGASFDSLVVATKYHPKKVFLSLFEYLADSRPFVIYCQYQEPLMELYVTLKDMRVAVNVDLTETWFRNVQVLSDRSHPEIVMSATGGYLLRGIKVKP